ncbi:hypothetical protein BKI52_26215 [marine bacterium AO1-C]|nr:hypothetical protein BKI52_26215 [marine bacterium AO1-C]
MTQPGVSKHLLALENHIGKKLFERTTRRLTPTEYGKFLYTQVSSPLQELKKVEYYSSQRTKKERVAIAIGCTSDFFKKELIHKIYSFDMYIVTQFGNEKELVEALEADSVQLLVGIKKHAMYDHQFTFLKSEDLVLIGSKNIEIPEGFLANEKQLIKWLQGQTWFTFDNDQNDIKAFWEANFSTPPTLVPRYILPAYLDIIEALTHNEGLAIVPLHLCAQALEHNLIQLPFDSLNPVKQKRYFSHKLRNSSLKEIAMFKEKMEIAQV